MQLERRAIRSDVSHIAAQLYLRVAAKRSKLAGFVLADSRGLVIAAQSSGQAADILAAFSPLNRPKKACADALEVPADNVHWHAFRLLGQECFLTAVGSGRPNMDVAAQAMGRIFAEAV